MVGFANTPYKFLKSDEIERLLTVVAAMTEYQVVSLLDLALSLQS